MSDAKWFKVRAPISESTRSQLVRVYALLTMGVVVAAIGCFADINYFHSGGLFTGLAGALMFAGARAVHASKGDNTATLLFLGAAGFEGMSLSPLVHTALRYYPQALISAALVSLAVFGSFSAAAVYAKRREFLYMTGIVGSMSSFLLIMYIANIFLRLRVIFDLQIYMGLGVMLLYVLIDTQIMIDRFETNQYYAGNYVRPACDLFIDLVGVFVRILIIFMRKAEPERRQRRSTGASSQKSSRD